MLTGAIRSVPLVDVVDCRLTFTPHAPLSSTNAVCHSPTLSSRLAFDIFHSGQGAQGLMGKASKQELAAAFDCSNATDALEILLTKGQLQSGDKFKEFGSGNDGRGGRITSAGAVGGGR